MFCRDRKFAWTVVGWDGVGTEHGKERKRVHISKSEKQRKINSIILSMNVWKFLCFGKKCSPVKALSLKLILNLFYLLLLFMIFYYIFINYTINYLIVLKLTILYYIVSSYIVWFFIAIYFVICFFFFSWTLSKLDENIKEKKWGEKRLKYFTVLFVFSLYKCDHFCFIIYWLYIFKKNK